MLDKILDAELGHDADTPKAQRKQKQVEETKAAESEFQVEFQETKDEDESALNKSQRDVKRGSGGLKVTHDFTVTEEHLKK